MELVSIIIPYFKKREYITATLNSVLKQTYKNFEILIIYDDQEKEDLKFLKKLIRQIKEYHLSLTKNRLELVYQEIMEFKNLKANLLVL